MACPRFAMWKEIKMLKVTTEWTSLDVQMSDMKFFLSFYRAFEKYKMPISLWSPYVIGQTIIFSCCGLFFFFFLSFFFSSPNLSSRRLDVYHTSAHGVVLV